METSTGTTGEERFGPLVIVEEGDDTLVSVPSVKHLPQVKNEDMGNEREGRATSAEDGEGRWNVEESTEKTEHIENNSGLVVEDVDSDMPEEVNAKVTDEGNVEGKEDVTQSNENCPDGPKEDEAAQPAETNMQLGPETEGLAVTATDIKSKEDKLPDSDAESTRLNLRPKDTLDPDDALKKVNRLTPDFPDALYELLYTLQEGRRLNDQRCSFRLKQRRRCYSEPSTPHHSNRVTFCSMTSLQREEFFELLATSQGRRLDDQRAEPQNIVSGSLQAAPASQTKTWLRRSSWKALEVKKVKSGPAPKEDLYNMILTSQAQGRLEDQRSAAPGPMDDEDFFSLLLRVQGGRMDEQRTELPVGVKY
ncbi:G-protein-signaling modulator 1 [Denticeps clupeoides]|uniref:G-protein-signaling modulator 1 n=1 Tax=Denticeps clupeoides TaxID=299321 RepID=UPI0010A4429E|nr:G-protein-signaling modulator 1-like [Denticeps clupeoides]XP_028837126.1 G-protein-signaling modulator 1-like [Denticeps clupeoides]XP_028837127.1 G-protein-signaling modulator 1-like [Denticeps clupeoides]XP_028837128.1 G-protein-signaling modulator 1-like [Denticeps clupeoides]